jgi:ribonuclease Z
VCSQLLPRILHAAMAQYRSAPLNSSDHFGWVFRSVPRVAADMKLLLLGSTGYHPNNIRQTACLMLPEVGVVLDAGTGMFRVRDHLTTSNLDIFLSHVHLDHSIGITFLFDVLFASPVARANVYGDGPKLDAIRQHLLHELLFPVAPPCDFHTLQGPVDLAGGGRLTYFPLEHPGGSLGFRLDWPGRSMAYVTDTTARTDADYVRHIRGVDLLVHECYFSDDLAEFANKTGHSNVTPSRRWPPRPTSAGYCWSI